MAYRSTAGPGAVSPYAAGPDPWGADMSRPYHEGLFTEQWRPAADQWAMPPSYNKYGKGQYGKGQYGKGQYGKGQYGKGQYGKGQYGKGQTPYWAPTPGGGFAKQYPPGMAGIPYAFYPGYGLVQ